MRTFNAKAVFANAVVATLFIATMAMPSQARLQDLAEPGAGPQNETIYRPVCWTEDGYERWLRCAAMQGGAVELPPHLRGR